MTALSFRSLAVRLDGTTILDDVSGSVDEGGWLTVIGPNGAGKSTLLRALAGLVPAQGSVRLDGSDTSKLRARELARRVALVPQTPSMPAEMTVAEYVLLGRTPHLGYLARESKGDRELAAEALRRLDLGRIAGRRLGTLSGGERQRAVLARALAHEAPLLLLDEPTSMLDIGRGQQALELVDSLRAEAGLTVVATMHDLTLAGQYADRLLLLDRGRVVAAGTPREVLTDELVARHYRAIVRVVEEEGAGLVVVPARAPASTRA
jgi:iron complex transport system ATP-binding protein